MLGAFAISLLGSAYSRLCKGYAFAAMVPGVLLLVPSGLIAVGGLAQNYSSNDDQFASGLNTGLAMIQSMCVAHDWLRDSNSDHTSVLFHDYKVSIAITIGLCLAAAGWHLFMTLKGYLTHARQDVMDCFAF